MIEVASVANSSGLVILWDDHIMELHDISTTHQEVHTMIKVCLT